MIVRRGTWFYHEGSNLRPCEENLAAQLEEVYSILNATIVVLDLTTYTGLPQNEAMAISQ